MNREAWDDRYRGSELVWKAGPNQFLVAEVEGLRPGRALDVACGEGRNALWLAREGWRVTGVDFSTVGLDKARQLAERAGVSIEWVAADLEQWAPATTTYDLIVLAYVQLKSDLRRTLHRRMAGALSEGGRMVVIAHDSSNLVAGVGGPQDPELLFSSEDVLADVAGLGLLVERAERVARVVATDDGEKRAIDLVVRVYQPGVA